MVRKPVKREEPETMTKRSKGDLNAIAEIAMRGAVVPINDLEVDDITYYIVGTIANTFFAPGSLSKFYDPKWSIFQEIRRYTQDLHVTHIGTSMIYGMPVITYVLRGSELIEPFSEDYGSGYPCATCYVFNPGQHDMCSEFGDCFFEKRKDGYYHRVS